MFPTFAIKHNISYKYYIRRAGPHPPTKHDIFTWITLYLVAFLQNKLFRRPPPAHNRAGCSCLIDRWPRGASSCKHRMRPTAYRTKKGRPIGRPGRGLGMNFMPPAGPGQLCIPNRHFLLLYNIICSQSICYLHVVFRISRNRIILSGQPCHVIQLQV